MKKIVIVALVSFLFSCSDGIDTSEVSKTTDGQQEIQNAKIKILNNSGATQTPGNTNFIQK